MNIQKPVSEFSCRDVNAATMKDCAAPASHHLAMITHGQRRRFPTPPLSALSHGRHRHFHPTTLPALTHGCQSRFHPTPLLALAHDRSHRFRPMPLPALAHCHQPSLPPYASADPCTLAPLTPSSTASPLPWSSSVTTVSMWICCFGCPWRMHTGKLLLQEIDFSYHKACRQRDNSSKQWCYFLRFSWCCSQVTAEDGEGIVLSQSCDFHLSKIMVSAGSSCLLQRPHNQR